MICVKMAEPINMQLGMLSWVGPGTCITWECRCPTGSSAFGSVWRIQKHCKALDFWCWI